jgi:hypothetical protein
VARHDAQPIACGDRKPNPPNPLRPQSSRRASTATTTKRPARQRQPRPERPTHRTPRPRQRRQPPPQRSAATAPNRIGRIRLDKPLPTRPINRLDRRPAIPLPSPRVPHTVGLETSAAQADPGPPPTMDVSGVAEGQPLPSCDHSDFRLAPKSQTDPERAETPRNSPRWPLLNTDDSQAFLGTDRRPPRP